ncbi:unnamed protein product [Clonostachys chloroleuca]|uniref:Mannan polymerase II complex ANP1 subunit n=1 Tax=Clonostachys chloroleuca TaxID=1926264 RepID=A0AA35Q0Y5_9HYPO|nr:unnamed protein product [Clonostachys chloroleuca]
MMPRHQASGFSNGYPREKTFDLSPHSFQPRTSIAAQRQRKRLFVRLGIVFFVVILITLWVWPKSAFASVLSLGLLGASSELELETVRYYDLTNVQGTARGWEREERILLCVPLRDAEPHLSMFFSHLRNFTYPHHLIDLAFLVSDSKDRTLEVLSDNLEQIQADPDPKQPYGEISIIEKDFGQEVNQDVESRHGFAAQASRRKLMAKARNWLLSAALRPYHSWVYWRDVDVETAPFTILEDLMRHNKDVIVPSTYFLYTSDEPVELTISQMSGDPFPIGLVVNSQSETALALADTLDEDAVIVEGYAEYATWRPHLAYLRDPYGDPDMEMEIDGVGGVSILAKAKVFRTGVHFPAFSFQKHAETEGFGKMAKRMKYSVVGLPHYVIWHLYEPSVDDIKHMEEMEQERIAREKEEEEKKVKAAKLKEQFGDGADTWEQDKQELKELKEKAAEEEKRRVKEEKAKVAQLKQNPNKEKPAAQDEKATTNQGKPKAKQEKSRAKQEESEVDDEKPATSKGKSKAKQEQSEVDEEKPRENREKPKPSRQKPKPKQEKLAQAEAKDDNAVAGNSEKKRLAE